MGLTSVELLIDISPMRISYSGNVIAYGYTDTLSARKCCKLLIINNKYKVNLRSISQTSTHYWVCGDDSTLLKVRKHDFLIERAIVDTLSNLTSVSFFNDLRGVVVGEFNSIFITVNGGQKRNRLKIADFAAYTYTKVLFTDANRFYVGGRNGVFLEMYEDQSGWTALKRRIFKEIDDDDEYLLVEGINDLYRTNIKTWGLSYSFSPTQSTNPEKDIMLIASKNSYLLICTFLSFVSIFSLLSVRFFKFTILIV